MSSGTKLPRGTRVFIASAIAVLSNDPSRSGPSRDLHICLPDTHHWRAALGHSPFGHQRQHRISPDWRRRNSIRRTFHWTVRSQSATNVVHGRHAVQTRSEGWLVAPGRTHRPGAYQIPALGRRGPKCRQGIRTGLRCPCCHKGICCARAHWTRICRSSPPVGWVDIKCKTPYVCDDFWTGYKLSCTTYLNKRRLANERRTGVGSSQFDGIISCQTEKLTSQLDQPMTRKSPN